MITEVTEVNSKVTCSSLALTYVFRDPEKALSCLNRLKPATLSLSVHSIGCMTFWHLQTPSTYSAKAAISEPAACEQPQSLLHIFKAQLVFSVANLTSQHGLRHPLCLHYRSLSGLSSGWQSCGQACPHISVPVKSLFLIGKNCGLSDRHAVWQTELTWSSPVSTSISSDSGSAQ